ncbi:MAG: enoyl-CoA hydratase/isomerase family protein [Porticoccaceae bacterium]
MSAVLRQDIDDITLLTLNRPNVRNAVNDEIVEALEQYLADLDDHNSKAIIITGAEKAFCAGTDLKEMQAQGRERYFQRIRRMHDLVARIRQHRCVSIAAVNGMALGGGMELAAACTFRVAHRSAIFSLPEILLGVMPCYAGTQTIARLIGEGRALELALTGRQISAQEAVDMGFVNRVPEHVDVVAEAITFARQLTRYSEVARNGIRTAIGAAFDMPLAQSMAVEREQAYRVFSSDDAQEGVSAFLEKREPRFTNH